jgi:hypothetical protein
MKTSIAVSFVRFLQILARPIDRGDRVSRRDAGLLGRRIDRDDVGSIALPVVGNKFDFLAVCCDVAVSHRITIS